MNDTPPRLQGTLIALTILAILLAAAGWSIYQLSAEPISSWTMLWVVIPLVAVPLLLVVFYRLYGLWTATYRLDRNGFFMRWGLAAERVPLAEIEGILLGENLSPRSLPGGGLLWPGLITGRRTLPEIGEVEFFCSAGPERMVLIRSKHSTIAITPSDAEAFYLAFRSAARMGVLEPLEALSRRPNFIIARIGADRAARLLIALGLGSAVTLLGYLAIRAPELSAQVAFGFGPGGDVSALAPAGRMLLLPFVAGLCWLVNLLGGVWFYRSDDQRPLAYAFWGASLLTTGLFWGAVLQLLAAVQP